MPWASRTRFLVSVPAAVSGMLSGILSGILCVVRYMWYAMAMLTD